MKFLGLQKLYDVIMPGNDLLNEAKNADAFAELVRYLDDRSLSLIIRDAKNDGRKALKIVRGHYLRRNKPRIISLYKQATLAIKRISNTRVRMWPSRQILSALFI